ncbi:MAG TPA: TerB family tellurite resistance protein [Bryobacteraceae bacterium]|nr:TerB family tellurite resistance protein [Bryobacteraceae bacterium]
MSILTFLGLGSEPQERSSAQTDAVREIVDALDRIDEDRACFIASFGYILSRVANADRNISPEETEAMERILVAQGQLSPEQAEVVVKMAKLRSELFGGTDNFLVTREFRRIATYEQKLALLDCLFAVSAASEDISMAENNQIRQIASELGLEHSEFIQVRLGWKDRLSVLKRDLRG